MSATKEQLEYNAYLLEIIRNCGFFKCTDCIYALWEDRGHGMEYKCCAPHTLPHSAWNDLETAMRGSACFAFEPSGQAKHNVVERMVKTQEAVAALEDYSWRHTERTVMRDSADEVRLGRICKEIGEQGMVRP
jgi:hypothetical protein